MSEQPTNSLARAYSLLLLMLAGLALSCAVFNVKLFVTPSPFAPSPVVDLAGMWDGHASNRSGEICRETVQYLPGLVPFGPCGGELQSWFTVKREFELPATTSSPELSLLIGDLGMLVAVLVNEVPIANGGLFPSAHHPERLYPLVFDIPTSVLKPSPTRNQIELQIFSLVASQAGPYKSPLGLYHSADAKAYARSQTMGTAFMPLACAIALALVLGGVGIYSLFYGSSIHVIFWYGAYCLSHICFLVSFSDINYDLVSMRWAIPVRFITGGRLADIALFALLVHFIPFDGFARRFYKAAFLLASTVAVITTGMVIWWALSDLAPIDVGARTQGIIEYVWRLKFISTTLGMIVSAFCLRSWKRVKVLVAFALLFAALYYESAVLFRLPYGDYASRFYAVVMAVILGSMIMREAATVTLTRVLNLEKDAAVGRSTAQVAHDIMSPLAALSMVARNAHKLDEDERLVLRAAADRISEIAGSLLSQRKSSHQELGACTA